MNLKIVIGLILCGTSSSNIPTREDNWPEDMTTPFPYPTPSPIDIVTADAKYTTCTSQLEVKIIVRDIRAMTNTGYSILITNADNYTTSATGIRGGFLKDQYTFDRCQFYWTDSIHESSGGSFNGEKGTALQSQYMHRNTKYDTFEEAILERDGLVIVTYNIQVKKECLNPGFEVFCDELKQITTAGCSINSTSFPFYLWAQTTPLFSYYYAYPGSYTDSATGKEYDCATIIVIPEESESCISEEQFNVFGQLHNLNGKPYTSSLKTSPRGKRPLITGHSLFINSIVYPEKPQLPNYPNLFYPNL